MTNLKKMMAALTAAMCMTAAVPAMEEAAQAAYFGEFIVIAVEYAEDTGAVESYLVLGDTWSQYAVTAAEMEAYLVPDSAQPQIGDVLDVQAELGHFDTANAPGYFEFSENSTITNIGTAETLYPAPRSYVLLREYEDTGYFLMQDVESGDKVTYRRQSYENYETPYNMNEAEIGDTVSFYYNEYDKPILPITVTKGDGTIPELPEAVIHEEYHTSPCIVIGANYSSGSLNPTTYLVSMDGTEMVLGSRALFEYMDEFAYPECGDVLMIDWSCILETYPGQLVIPQNGVITNAGKAEELYGTKSFTVTGNNGYQLDLTDADGNAEYYYYGVMDMGYNLYHSDVMQAQVGDTVTFALDENGDPVLPVTETEYATPVEKFAVIAVDDAENPQNFIIKAFEKYNSAYHLNAGVLADCLADGEKMPEFGDILELTGHMLEYRDTFTHSDDFNLQMTGENLGTDVNDGVIRNVGSVFDNCEELEMQYTEVGEFDYYFCNISFTTGGNILYPCDYLRSYVQPGCVDLRKLHYGDMVTMVTYDGIPVFPSASASVLGDVNGDNGLDILDVIALNKSLLAGAELPALMGARSGSLGQCDFNGNGTLDMDDSLGMMKRILNIES